MFSSFKSIVLDNTAEIAMTFIIFVAIVLFILYLIDKLFFETTYYEEAAIPINEEFLEEMARRESEWRMNIAAEVCASIVQILDLTTEEVKESMTGMPLKDERSLLTTDLDTFSVSSVFNWRTKKLRVEVIDRLNNSTYHFKQRFDATINTLKLESFLDKCVDRYEDACKVYQAYQKSSEKLQQENENKAD